MKDTMQNHNTLSECFSVPGEEYLPKGSARVQSQRPTPFYYGLTTIACLGAFLFITACSGKKAAFSPSVPVTIARAVIQSAPLSIQSVGTVEPIESVELKAQVSGIISQIHFIEGLEVCRGQLLIQIDPRPFQAALDAATAQLARDSVQSVNARIQADRYAELVKKSFVTQEQYDDVRTQAVALESAVQVDKAMVEQAELNLGYTSITAPITGRTGSLLVKKGNIVKANDATLVVINQMHPIRISFSIPDNQLPLVHHYAAHSQLDVKVKPSRNDDSSQVQGKLTFIDNAVDSQTGTVTLKAEFTNEEGRLWPGQFADTELILTVETKVLTIPFSAIVTGQDGTFVFVVNPDNKVEKREVKVNRTLDNTSIIEEGLREGETVVTDGQLRLVPGAVVEIKTAQPEREKTR
jgi:multidrug efflux system membrane fusion protein